MIFKGYDSDEYYFVQNVQFTADQVDTITWKHGNLYINFIDLTKSLVIYQTEEANQLWLDFQEDADLESKCFDE